MSKFFALSGVNSEDPLSYLLIIEDFYILLDCGWNEKFDLNSSYITELKKYVPKLNVILLSHSTLNHVGALPYIIGKLGCKADGKFKFFTVVYSGKLTFSD